MLESHSTDHVYREAYRPYYINEVDWDSYFPLPIPPDLQMRNDELLVNTDITSTGVFLVEIPFRINNQTKVYVQMQIVISPTTFRYLLFWRVVPTNPLTHLGGQPQIDELFQKHVKPLLFDPDISFEIIYRSTRYLSYSRKN